MARDSARPGRLVLGTAPRLVAAWSLALVPLVGPPTLVAERAAEESAPQPGETIAFARLQDGKGGIYTMNADGTEETLLVENPDPLGYGEPAWTLRCRHAYGDVPAWVEDAVSWASCNRHMTGYPDNRFKPDDPMTRAQVARLLYRIAGTADTDSLPAHGFTDVPSWADDAITWLSAYDYANGYPDQTFGLAL